MDEKNTIYTFSFTSVVHIKDKEGNGIDKICARDCEWNNNTLVDAESK